MSDKERPGFKDAEFLFRNDSPELDRFHEDHAGREDDVEKSMWHSVSNPGSMLPGNQGSFSLDQEPLLADDVHSFKPDVVGSQSKKRKDFSPVGGAQRGKKAGMSQKLRARLRLGRK